ncbi:kinase-like protein [Amniculicola lignicola CBS 123094]|uniref:non-specific serine/threonine protein kinase n=1 Tax=Amniculicola lignicola CBS 123094 TaxID=1392246 RepID=A0A6A5WWG5_9PLEO|nr:kinase-like protein [Amniculicola lignicola CBS 123094]
MDSPPSTTPSWRRISPSIDPRFEVIRHLNCPGNCNVGIRLVRDTITDRICIEKRCSHCDIEDGSVAREINALERLKGRPEIVEIISSLLLKDRRGQSKGSIFMEYGNKGSLGDLIRVYGNRAPSNDVHIPELFIWKVIWALANAILVCQYGPTPESSFTEAVNTPIWNMIYHRDITPDNVLLISPAEDMELYPRVVLADFGVCVTEDDVQKGVCIPGQNPEFEPPETINALSAASDIWQIGASIYCLMAEAAEPYSSYNSTTGTFPLSNSGYSSALANIVAWCTKLEPKERPTCRDLVSEISKRRTELDGILAEEPLLEALAEAPQLSECAES